MFNLLISSDPESWSSGSYHFERSRVAIEYTSNEISERYKSLDAIAIEELKGFTSIFATEQEQTESKIGRITDIKVHAAFVIIEYEFDPIFPPLPKGAIERVRSQINLGKFELYRTHWAVKEEPILEVLLKNGFITSQQLEASQKLGITNQPNPQPISTKPGEFDTKQVFIVHGHDDIAKLEMASFIKGLGLEPIILHLQPSSGR
ncbi:MAG: DNA-binding protein, partial [Marivirga sp.]|nr:DNA-binding protein [Marivirga sp.]